MKKLILPFVFLFLLLPGCAGQTVSNAPSADFSSPADDSSLAAVQQKGVLMAGIFHDIPPMVFKNENGKTAGLDIDLMDEIASRLGLKITYKEYQEWDDFLKAAETGEADLTISSMTITAERMQKMLFSAPYFNGGQVIVVKKENADINDPEDLQGKKISVLGGTTCEAAALEHTDPSLVLKYETQADVVSHLLNGDADAPIFDYVISADIVKNNPSLRMLEGQITEEYYGIATKLGNQALMEAVNAILRDVQQEGFLKELEKKWLK